MSRIDVQDIAPLLHDEAMDLAVADYERLLDLVDDLRAEDWRRSTDCAGWDVQAVVGHLLGMLELQADPEDRKRQIQTAALEAERTGGLRLDELTALQVREHAHLTPGERASELRSAAARGLAARRGMPAEFRSTPYDPQLPGVTGWTFGYLFDVIHTRDPWLHRIDISRACDRAPELSASVDGRIVADVVADWARTHNKPFALDLTGPAGGKFVAGTGGLTLELDAVEFCRKLSGRSPGAGLLGQRVVF